MKEFTIINRCLGLLKSSKIDIMTKLRMENLLIGIKVLLLVDADEQAATGDLEELFCHVKEVCTGDCSEGTRGLIEHVRKMQSSMVACLNLNC